MKPTYTFHVISNTHWDREWRFTFQRNRQLLVEMIDSLIQILENDPGYKAFHLDSQTIILEDYLEIRPQQRPKLEKLIKEKRILVGPLFILPEEFQVGGESLIRNLLLGHRMAEAFGHVMKVGYSPFSWGQISQLPQIYAGFGIDVIMFYRGVNSLDSPKAEFIWEGADGTRTLTTRFSTMPRYNFYFYVYRPVIHDEHIADVEYKWSKGGLPFHFADNELKDEDYNLLKPKDQYHKKNLKPAVTAIIDKQINDFTTPHVFWAEGHDSSGPNAKTVRLIKDADDLLRGDLVKHSSLEEYANALKKAVDYDKLKCVKGERRSSQYDYNSGNLYGYTTSARMYLKQENFDVERWLQYYAEPFNVIAGMLGMDTKDQYIDRAWHYLLQNSAHDSIGGCSLDTIHEDMMFRYKQAKEISKGLFNRACRFLASNIDLREAGPNSIHLVAVNPLSFRRNEIAEAFIDIPEESDTGSIQIFENDGRSVEMQFIKKVKAEPVLEQMIDRPMFFKMQRYQVLLELQDIPALGYRTFNIDVDSPVKDHHQDLIRQRNNDLMMENEHLLVNINRNGTLKVLHKKTGQIYDNLCWFRDEGEAGHAWVHEPVRPFFDSLESHPDLTILQNGPLQGKIMIEHLINVPADLDSRQHPGTGSCVEMPIKVILCLKKYSLKLELEIEIDNKAESHRLRLMFPTGIKAEYSHGEGQFDVVPRTIKRPDTSDWVEQPMYDYPMHHFVDVSDGEKGAAILVDGLKEYEVFDDADRILAITLFRGFRYIIQPSSKQDFSHQKGSQCLGKQTYRLAFYPHDKDWEQARVYQEALNFNFPLRLFQMGRSEGNLPRQLRFVEIVPDTLIMSCVKFPGTPSKNSFILRLYNPTVKTIEGKIIVFSPIKMVEEITLEEIPVRKLKLEKSDELDIKVNPKKIMTLKITMIGPVINQRGEE